MKKLLLIALLVAGLTFIFSQQSILDVIANVPNATEIKINKKDNSKLLDGTIYNYNSSKLFLNTACLQKRDYITIGIATGSFTGVGYLIALGSSPLTEKYKVLSVSIILYLFCCSKCINCYIIYNSNIITKI